MIRIMLVAAAAIFGLATPTIALARDGDRTFTHEGVTYVYTVSAKGDARVIEGKGGNGDFRLVVKNGWVDGHVANTKVSFREPKAKTLRVAER